MGKIRKTFSLLVVSLMLMQGAAASYVSADSDPNSETSSSTTSSSESNSSINTPSNSNEPSNNSSTTTSQETPSEQVNEPIVIPPPILPIPPFPTFPPMPPFPTLPPIPSPTITPLVQLNQAVAVKEAGTVLSILKNTDLLTQSEAFSELTDQEQMAIAATLVQLTPDSGSYNEDQVQFLVDAGAKALKAYRLDYRDMAYELKNSTNKFF